jgi:hypothetical protein
LNSVTPEESKPAAKVSAIPQWAAHEKFRERRQVAEASILLKQKTGEVCNLAGFLRNAFCYRCEPAWRADKPVNSGNGLRYLTLS